ncbi:hypothetical protein D3C76_1459420 [compost metagenome]
METAANSDQWFANGHYWLGGEANPNFPIFANDVIASIAIAVGVYAGIIQAMPTGTGVHLRPRFDTPMVKRTWEVVQANNLTLKDAKDLFITLMQDEEFRLDVPVADDFIANPFIAEFGVGVDTTIEEARNAAREIGE